MRLPQDYDSEILILAVTALDWRSDYSEAATRLIQSSITEHYGERLGEEDAVWVLGSLLNRRLIRMQVHPDEVGKSAADAKIRRRARYVRIPPDERQP